MRVKLRFAAALFAIALASGAHAAGQNNGDKDAAEAAAGAATRTISKTDPDPSFLTTQNLRREIAGLRELIEATVAGVIGKIETRLNGMDKAIELLQRSTDKMPEFVRGEVKQLQSLTEERFRSIETQFKERDTRGEQSGKDSKIAIDAALASAEKAVGKTETNFGDRIKTQDSSINTMRAQLEGNINDLKIAVSRIESKAIGGRELVQTQQEVSTATLAIFGLLIAVASIISSVVVAVVMRPRHVGS